MGQAQARGGNPEGNPNHANGPNDDQYEPAALDNYRYPNPRGNPIRSINYPELVPVSLCHCVTVSLYLWIWSLLVAHLSRC